MFIQYNLAQSYNEDAEEPNTVTVTEAVGQEEVSVRLAALSSGESYAVYDGTDRIFVVEVCSIQNTVGRPPYAFVSIHRERDGSQCSEDRISAVNENVATGQGNVDWESLLNFQRPTVAPLRAPTPAPIAPPPSPEASVVFTAGEVTTPQLERDKIIEKIRRNLFIRNQ